MECSMRKPEMCKSGKLKEERVWRKGLTLTDAARIEKWTYAHWIRQEVWKFSRAKSNTKVMEQWQNCSIRKAGGEVETSGNLRIKVQGMFHMKVVSHADLFVWKHLSIYDIVLVNQNAFDLMSNWVTELPYILNSLPRLVTFLVHQNID